MMKSALPMKAPHTQLLTLPIYSTLLYRDEIRPLSSDLSNSIFRPHKEKSGFLNQTYKQKKTFFPSHPFVSNSITCEGRIDDVLISKKLDEDKERESSSLEIIFLGTGTSEGIPRVSCLTHPEETCEVCHAATKPGNPNRRRNTSLVLRYIDSNGTKRNVLIDAGKFFYHSALQWFPHFGLRNIDAVLITHSHADAIGGLDDLRDWTNNIQDSVDIYVAERDFKVLESTHYYLVDSKQVTPGTAVSKLKFNVFHKKESESKSKNGNGNGNERTLDVHGMKFTPLPVWHGKNYLSLGFRFENVCYISDVSEIPESTYPLLENCELLILDALRPGKSSATHFGLPEAIQEVKKINPKRTLFTGMMHSMNHDIINAQLREYAKEGLHMELAYDGLHLCI